MGIIHILLNLSCQGHHVQMQGCIVLYTPGSNTQNHNTNGTPWNFPSALLVQPASCSLEPKVWITDLDHSGVNLHLYDVESFCVRTLTP